MTEGCAAACLPSCSPPPLPPLGAPCSNSFHCLPSIFKSFLHEPCRRNSHEALHKGKKNSHHQAMIRHPPFIDGTTEVREGEGTVLGRQLAGDEGSGSPWGPALQGLPLYVPFFPNSGTWRLLRPQPRPRPASLASRQARAAVWNRVPTPGEATVPVSPSTKATGALEGPTIPFAAGLCSDPYIIP